jgi:hypothetical protein
LIKINVPIVSGIGRPERNSQHNGEIPQNKTGLNAASGIACALPRAS